MTACHTRAQAREISERILANSTADAAQVTLSSRKRGFTRFAENQVTTAGDTSEVRATVTSVYDQQSASVSFNDLSDVGIEQAVARSEGFAKLAPTDPERMPLLGPQTYVDNVAFASSTGEVTADDRVTAALGVTRPAAAAALVATGFIEHSADSLAVANSRGLFAFHRSTVASYTTTVRTPSGDGSGWAGTTHNDWEKLTPAAELADTALRKAEQSVSATSPEPGAYTVVLEPTAVGNLVQLLRGALDARAADEGRSYFAKAGGGSRIGEQVIDQRLSLVTDPTDIDTSSRPFSAEGEPVLRTEWVREGRLAQLATSRYWANRRSRTSVPLGQGITLLGGIGSTEDLIGGVARGLLVTRFWYIRPVSRRQLSYTGLTRDGTFLIEGGQVTSAVKNMRFNQSVMTMLNNVAAVGSAVRVVASESGGAGQPVVVPPLVVNDFHFTSVSEAV